MKIVILARYPRIENSAWKRSLIDQLMEDGYEVSIIFGESSFYRHFKAALKEYGFSFLHRKKQIERNRDERGNKINLYKYCKSKIKIYSVQSLNKRKCENIIRKIAPDYLLLLGSGIIRKNILELPKKKVIHCHHGQLPGYRGVSTAEWSLYNDSDVYITTHIVDAGVDTGGVLMERKIEIIKGDTIDDIRYRCRTESVSLLIETFRGLRNNILQPQLQIKGQGKQFYFMHPFFKKIVEQRLARISS